MRMSSSGAKRARSTSPGGWSTQGKLERLQDSAADGNSARGRHQTAAITKSRFPDEMQGIALADSGPVQAVGFIQEDLVLLEILLLPQNSVGGLLTSFR